VDPFASPSAVIASLHSHPHDALRSKQLNEIIMALLGTKQSYNGHALFQALLLLAFVPTLHKTYRETSFRFTNLYREDIAQQTLTSFLELTRALALQRRNGYLSAAPRRDCALEVAICGLKQRATRAPLPVLRLHRTRGGHPGQGVEQHGRGPSQHPGGSRVYGGHHVAEKAKAGFSIYAPADDAPRLRAALQDPELITEILSL
jgi:hypothetical protein